jgi:hypothetical protein
MSIDRQPLRFGVAQSGDEVLTVCRIAGTLPLDHGSRLAGRLHLEEADHCYAKDLGTGEIVAAMILTYPSERRARADGSSTGLAFGRRWEDSSLAAWRLAQMSSVAVVLPYRVKSAAAAVLFEGVEAHLFRRGIGAVIGTASLETCDAFQAGLATLAARERGATRAGVWLERRAAGRSAKPLYTLEQLCCLSGGLARLPLPYEVQRCIGLGAPVCGEPLPDEETGMYRVPILASVERLVKVA